MKEDKQNYLNVSSFSVILIFVFLGVVGLFLTPFLSLRLYPQQAKPVISVNFSWTDQNPRIIESEVTSKIEQSLSSMPNVVDIRSTTSKGQGNVQLEFDEKVDIDKVSLYISTVIKRIYTTLPEGVTYPSINKNNYRIDDSQTLMSLAISGNTSREEIYNYTQGFLQTRLSKIKGVNNIKIFGIPKNKYTIFCPNSKLERYNLERQSVMSTIKLFLDEHDVGRINFNGVSLPLKIDFEQKHGLINDLLNISVLNRKNKVISLKDVISISKIETKPEGYKRYNGNNALLLNVSSNQQSNQLSIANKIRKEIQLIENQFKNKHIHVNLVYDSTTKLDKELRNVIIRILLSLSILILFIFITSFNLKHVLIVFTSLIINILFAIIFYQFLSIDIHLYSLAGLTISLGIVIDNTIVMTDHIINQKNNKAFIPILASSVTTIGALIVVFFIKKEFQIYLYDFSWIIIINISTSLLVTLFLVPSLNKHINNEGRKVSFATRKKIIVISWIYRIIIVQFIKKKKVLIGLIVLVFGLPFFLVPKDITENSVISKEINTILKSDFYKDKLYSNFKYLGGTLYLFLKNIEESNFVDSPQRLALNINLYNSEGGTIVQLEKAIKLFEKRLIDIEEVELFLTNIYSHESGAIKVFFQEKHEKTDTPYIVKNKLEEIAVQIGGIDCSIFGVGQPFSNGGDIVSDATIKLSGYNIDNLLKLAYSIKKNFLLKHPRISNVKINSEKSWILKDKYEFLLELSENRPFTRLSSNNKALLDNIKWNSGNEFVLSSFKGIPVVIAETNNYSSYFDLKKSLIKYDSLSYSIEQIANIKKTNVASSIKKNNGDYEVFLDYSFAGSYLSNNYVKKQLIEEIKNEMPIGYQVSNPENMFFNKNQSFMIVTVILFIIAIIYFICAILFESLALPFAIILTIPSSFIGVFLTFSLFDLPFDQGGVASFIMLSGIVVNSSIYIVNQFKIESKNGISNISVFIKAITLKIWPILLTIGSTILGLFPFLLMEDSFFWTSFAYGNIGGLLFSFFILLFFLPIYLNLKIHEP